MPEREGFPAGVPSWIDTEQADVDAAATFYAGVLGWQFDDRTPPGTDGRYLVATLDGRAVAGISSLGGRSHAPARWNTYIAVDDADEAVTRVRDASGSVVTGPSDVGDLGRAAACADPAGAAFRLWQPGSLSGAESVNVPGAWNFSELNTSDAAGATRFYGAAFGWKVDEVDMGAISGTMVRLPGYADFLEQFDPGIRKRHADFGAPPGFTECVAWILPLQPGASPHWSVSFAVADADAVAAAARDLGGSVVVEPFDIPPVRSTVIDDPAGARFTANVFKPG